MVVSVAAYPNSSELWICDNEEDKYEKFLCSVIVQPWEHDKVDQYFQNITQMVKKSIDKFYLFLPIAYYNEILKKFIEVSKKYKIDKIQLISHFEQSATSSLEYIDHKLDTLWILECQFLKLLCTTWTKSDNCSQLNISQVLVQNRTSSDKKLVKESIQNLTKSMNELSTLFLRFFYLFVGSCFIVEFKKRLILKNFFV